MFSPTYALLHLHQLFSSVKQSLVAHSNLLYFQPQNFLPLSVFLLLICFLSFFLLQYLPCCLQKMQTTSLKLASWIQIPLLNTYRMENKLTGAPYSQCLQLSFHSNDRSFQENHLLSQTDLISAVSSYLAKVQHSLTLSSMYPLWFCCTSPSSFSSVLHPSFQTLLCPLPLLASPLCWAKLSYIWSLSSWDKGRTGTATAIHLHSHIPFYDRMYKDN